MPVQLVCKCGKQLRIPDDHAGRRFLCPSCGASHLAPVAESASLPGAERPSGGKGRGRLLPVVFLLLLLIGGAAAVWWFFSREAGPAKEGDDLALIPANAQGFVSLRLADLWKTPAARKGLQDASERESWTGDPAEQMDRSTGLRPEEVERLTLVGVDAERQIWWGIVRTLQPYDRRKVLSRLKDPRENVHRGERYYLGAGPDGQPRAIHFAGTRVLVAGTEENVKRCLDFTAEAPPAGPLAPMIVLAGGEHTAVVGIQAAGGPLEKVKANPMLQGLADTLVKGLTEMKMLTATLDVNEKATLEAKVKMSGDQEAKQMVQTIRANKGVIIGMLLWAQFKGGVEGKAASLLSLLLGKAKFVPKGDEATMTVTIDQGSKVADLLIALPRR